VEQLRAFAPAEHVAQLAKPAAGEPVPARQPHVLRVESPTERDHAVAVVGIALVVLPVPVQSGPIGRGVDVVGGPSHRRHAARDQRLAQALRRDRQVRHRAEAAEALAQDAPPPHAELAPNPFGVAHYRVGAEMLQVAGLLLWTHPRQGADRAGATGAALVEHQHAEVAQSAVQPRRAARESSGPRRLVARAALEENEERPILPVGVADFAREYGDASSLFT